MAGNIRQVFPEHLPDLLELLSRDPVAHCFVESRVQVGGVDPWKLGGEVLGYFRDDQLISAMYSGANLIPIETTPEARAAFVDAATEGATTQFIPYRTLSDDRLQRIQR